MMKYAILMAGFVVLAVAQRPPYAGSRDRNYPQVLPQYLPNGESTPGIDNRLGDTTGSSSSVNSAPYDPMKEYFDQQAALPEDKQSFEFLNRQQIAAHLGLKNSASSSAPVPTRGSFVKNA